MNRFFAISIVMVPIAVLADPPTPKIVWESIGLSAFMKADSIVRDGDIVSAIFGRGLTKVDGQWTHSVATLYTQLRIDCKEHTFKELHKSSDLLGDISVNDNWVLIKPHTYEAMAEKRVCTKQTASQPTAEN